MSDRVYALTVILDNEMRAEDADEVMSALRMIKGVQSVAPLVADAQLWYAKERARMELINKLWDVLRVDATA